MSLPRALRHLRHLYEQMLAGQVKDTASAARGLLGPAIEILEQATGPQCLEQPASEVAP